MSTKKMDLIRLLSHQVTNCKNHKRRGLSKPRKGEKLSTERKP